MVRSYSQSDRVLAINLAKCKVFYPTQMGNQQMHALCVNLAREMAICLLLEVADLKKATSDTCQHAMAGSDGLSHQKKRRRQQ